MLPTFSIVIATKGRESLTGAFASAASQLRPGDEILVLCNDAGDWGHSARNAAMPRAAGTHLLFMDDDDEYLPGALDAIRRFSAEHPDRIGIFRMRYFEDGRYVWNRREFRYKNVGTPCFVVPNVPGKLGRWDTSWPGGDWSFIEETVALQGPPVFCDEVIAVIEPDHRPWVIRQYAELRFKLALRSRVRGVLRGGKDS
ncbi:MAG TPA: glycosyltransferase [Gaiellaceae bacterium]|nr:glycosyltransferase [Gaiellaceae bacterium]